MGRRPHREQALQELGDACIRERLGQARVESKLSAGGLIGLGGEGDQPSAGLLPSLATLAVPRDERVAAHAGQLHVNHEQVKHGRDGAGALDNRHGLLAAVCGIDDDAQLLEQQLAGDVGDLHAPRDETVRGWGTG